MFPQRPLTIVWPHQTTQKYFYILSKKGLLLLCEVALGNPFLINGARPFIRPPLGYHSVKGVGKMKPTEEGIKDFLNPNNDFKIGSDLENYLRFDSGSIVETYESEILVEEGKKSSELLYNEYIVYDYSQVKEY